MQGLLTKKNDGGKCQNESHHSLENDTVTAMAAVSGPAIGDVPGDEMGYFFMARNDHGDIVERSVSKGRAVGILTLSNVQKETMTEE